MKKILLFVGALVVSLAMFAQNCQPVMPGVTYIIYDSDGEHMNSGDALWVCSGVTLEISGDGNTVFVEKNCNITLSGDGNQFYQKRGGSLTIDGNNNSPVTFEAALTYTDNGTGNSLGTCDTLKYDYGNAPMPPAQSCDVFAGVDDLDGNGSFGLYPNPASTSLYFNLPSSAVAEVVEVFSTDGKLIHSALLNDQNEINVNGLEKGLYLFMIHTNKGSFSERVQIE